MHTVKDHLARLLATEDLVVEHRQVDTASFDVERRVLTLPVWDKAESVVIDLLISHEVGHALYTPNDWSFEGQVPMQFVNIVEDIRIEKLMKRRYAGLAKTFYKGYSILSDKDFFGIGDDDLSTFNLADKLNLYFKIGNYINVPFDEEEKEFVKRADRLETFDEVIAFAKELYDFCTEKVKQEQEKVDDLQNPPQSSESGGSSEGQSSTTPQSSRNDGGEEDEEEGEEETEEKVDGDGPGRNEDEPVEAKTADNFEQALEQLVNHGRTNTTYLELPDSIDDVVVSNRDCQSVLSEYYVDRNCIWVDDEYRKYKSNVLKEVNYLVKEFECKKAADSYARSSTARTGVLDCTKLHTYKYNEDLFKKVTVIPDGKNHGLVFVLDWSGSMADVMIPTLKQLYNLIWFCRKVGIPYDVFAFTNEWNYRAKELPTIPTEEDKLYISDSFSMMNILTSKVSNSVAEKQMINIWNIASSFTDYSGICPPGMYLSGTPLNEALLTLHHIIPNFQKKHGLEKVNCVILTDGEASPLSRTVMLQRNWEGEAQIRNRRCTDQTFLRNRKTGSMIRLSMVYHVFTKALLDDLKDTFPEVNFIGYRIIGPGCSYNSMIYSYLPEFSDQDKARTQWRKEKTFTIKNYGYDSYIVLGNSVLSNSVDFEVKEDASKSQIKNAFRKSLANKKMNKRVLNEFIALVA